MARAVSALVARRLARVVAVVIGVTAVAWLLAEAAPGAPAERAARAAGLLPPDEGAVGVALRAEILAQVAEAHDLERPAAARIAGRLVALARGDLGRSWRDGAPVRGRVAAALAPTAILLGLALALAIGLGLSVALVSARRMGGVADVVLGGIAAVAVAVPPVWLAILGLRTFAAGAPWRWLPPGGLDGAAAAVLPVAALALVPAFVIARHGRAALVEAAATPWAVAVRARGVSEGRLLAVHALRVALPALLPLATVLVAYLLGAAMVIERAFGIRGVGALLVDAAAAGDAPVVVGVCAVAGALVALVSAAVDLGVRALDPRVRGDGAGERRAG
jgi:peptide/nickel transport system permease protein